MDIRKEGKFLCIEEKNEEGKLNNIFLIEDKGQTEGEIDTIITQVKQSRAPKIEDLRREEYEKEGITPQMMIIALWELAVENRPQAVNELQAKRQAIKEKYPKN